MVQEKTSAWPYLDGGKSVLAIGFESRPILGPQNTILEAFWSVINGLD